MMNPTNQKIIVFIDFWVSKIQKQKQNRREREAAEAKDDAPRLVPIRTLTCNDDDDEENNEEPDEEASLPESLRPEESVKSWASEQTRIEVVRNVLFIALLYQICNIVHSYSVTRSALRQAEQMLFQLKSVIVQFLKKMDVLSTDWYGLHYLLSSQVSQFLHSELLGYGRK